MIDYISKWFSAFTDTEDTPSRDGLEQGQREAIIDLLLLAMHSDNHLAISEKEVLEDQIGAFDWRSGSSVEIYVEEATARVREADETDEGRAGLFTELAERLGTEDAKVFALDLCKKLFQADADVDMEEISFLSELRKAMGL